MQFRRKLFMMAEKIWMDYLEHPFILGIGDGTLDREKFKNYLVQDYIYLKEYSKVFCAGIIKSNDMKEMRFLYNSIAGAMEEGASHIKYMESLGITEGDAEKGKALGANENYTDYMMNIAFQGNIYEIAIATLPCTWSYNFIGNYLKENFDVENNFYKEWIDLYSGEEFNKFTSQWLNYVDSLCENISKEQEIRLLEIFYKCSAHELNFWNMAWNS